MKFSLKNVEEYAEKKIKKTIEDKKNKLLNKMNEI